MAILWASNIYGFGTDSIRHLAGHGPPYPAIVHVHAVAFVGWQVILTIQIVLVGKGRIRLHRRLGCASVGLAAIMVPLGIATAFIVDAAELGHAHAPPAFVFLQTADMILFALLVGWAVASRHDAGVHKRLMMLSAINLSAAGYARWAHPLLAPLVGPSLIGAYAAGNLPMALMIAAMVLFDQIRLGRPHRVWAVALPLILAVELFQTWVVGAPAMNAIARHILASR